MKKGVRFLTSLKKRIKNAANDLTALEKDSELIDWIERMYSLGLNPLPRLRRLVPPDVEVRFIYFDKINRRFAFQAEADRLKKKLFWVELHSEERSIRIVYVEPA